MSRPCASDESSWEGSRQLGACCASLPPVDLFFTCQPTAISGCHGTLDTCPAPPLCPLLAHSCSSASCSCVCSAALSSSLTPAASCSGDTRASRTTRQHIAAVTLSALEHQVVAGPSLGCESVVSPSRRSAAEGLLDSRSAVVVCRRSGSRRQVSGAERQAGAIHAALAEVTASPMAEADSKSCDVAGVGQMREKGLHPDERVPRDTTQSNGNTQMFASMLQRNSINHIPTVVHTPAH
eukprot:766505-Hanusia_phi.AAC.1